MQSLYCQKLKKSFKYCQNDWYPFQAMASNDVRLKAADDFDAI